MSSIAARMFGLCLMAPALLSVAPSAFAGQPAQAQPNVQETAPPQAAPKTCLPHKGVDGKLRSEFGEKVLGRGISKDGTLLEIFMAQNEGTFTVIKTTPDGTSCVVDFGEGWQTLNQLESVGFGPQDLKPVPTPPF
ncbi:MAG TPA: hypothetical protein VGJ75_09770 [Dongiaceae bacterium]|jgi:hypothetical protein